MSSQVRPAPITGWLAAPFRSRLKLPDFARSSIRSRLGLLIAAAVLPVVLASAIVLRQQYINSLHHSTETVLLIRGAALARADAAFDHLREILASVRSKSSALTDPNICHAALREAADPRKIEFTNIVVLDSNGQIRCNAFNPADPGRAEFDFISKAWLARLKQSKDFTLGDVGIGAVMGGPVILGALPIMGESGFAGAVVASLRLDYLLPRDIDPREIGSWLLPAQGAPMPIGNTPEMANPPEAVLQRLQISDAPTPVTKSVGNVSYVYAAAELAGEYRLVVAYRATQDRRRALHSLLRRSAEIGVLLLLGLGAVLYGANAFIVRPVKRLNCQVANWRRGGEFDISCLRGAPSELRELADSFREAASWLTERELQLRGASAQQELLMQEIHHRVKNNLQIVASLLNLQAARIRLPEARAEFQSARDRVRALATLHRHLYTHGEVHTINMRSFLMELCGQLFQAMGEQEGDRIHLHIEAPELQMSSDQAVPMALIVTEAVSNAIKYAFPGGRHGHIRVQLTEETGSARLLIQDDGVGIPAGRTETETGTRDGIGIQLIRGFARQLGARLTVDEGDGTRYEVILPLRREREGSGEALAGGAPPV